MVLLIFSSSGGFVKRKLEFITLPHAEYVFVRCFIFRLVSWFCFCKGACAFALHSYVSLVGKPELQSVVGLRTIERHAFVDPGTVLQIPSAQKNNCG